MSSATVCLSQCELCFAVEGGVGVIHSTGVKARRVHRRRADLCPPSGVGFYTAGWV